MVPPEASALSGPCPDCGTIIHGPNSPEALREKEAASQKRQADEEKEQAEQAEQVTPLQATQAAPEENPASPPQAQEPPQKPIAEEAEEPAKEAPKPKPSPRREPPRRSGLSLPVVILLASFLSALFFILGFFFGKTGRGDFLNPPPAALIKTENPPTLSNQITPPPKIDINEIVPPPKTLPERTNETEQAQTVLEAFLNASSWGVRNAYVHNPDEALSNMEEMAQQHGDGPIPFDDLSLAFSSPEEQVFQLLALKDEKPFLVSVVKVGSLWQVDWDTFSEFYYDKFEAFATGSGGASSGVFHLRLKPAPDETDPLAPSKLLAHTPNSTKSFPLTFAIGTGAQEKVASLLAILDRDQPETLSRLMATDGIPLVVRISRSGASSPELQLEEVVATTWSRKALTK